MQIELINYNNFKKNISFIRDLSEYYIFYDCKNFKKLSLNEAEVSIKNTLSKSATFDLFFVNKDCKP